MAQAPDPGVISIEVTLNHGVAHQVAIASTRPTSLSQLLAGRPVAEVPALVGRLYSLCGQAQAIASDLAITAATGESRALDPPQAIALLAERAGEYIRAAALESLGEGRSPPPEAAIAYRQALAAVRDVLKQAADPAELGDMAATVASLRSAARALPRPGAAPAGDLPFVAPDALDPQDDAAIITAFRDGGAEFAAHPALPGRILETGTFARLWRRIGAVGGLMAARTAARRLDLAQALETLEALAAQVTGQTEPCSDLGMALPLGPGEGCGVVESPRGRLYHLARVESGLVRSYAILAPTEWNFHPDGPLAAALRGAHLGEGEAARNRVERLAALFDPCVASRVTIREGD